MRLFFHCCAHAVSMSFDIDELRRQYQGYLDQMVDHFAEFFQHPDYSGGKLKTREKIVSSQDDLRSVLYGPGLYIVATDFPTKENRCKLKLNGGLSVVYRGHSSNVRERVESHLFYDTYRDLDAGRRFDVCMKLGGKNINIDKGPFSESKWIVRTHSMPRSNAMIRTAAELAFDKTFDRPVGSDK